VLSAWLDPLRGGWLVVLSGSGLTTAGLLLYRLYRLRVAERMHARQLGTEERTHARELESAERKHARELEVAWGAAQLGAVATFQREGIAVMPSIPAPEVIPPRGPEAQIAPPD
jgi:hypothetical protein